MDMEGRPEGTQEVDQDSGNIHHDPLNEFNEETWSALGELEDEGNPSNTELLRPPLSVQLPARGATSSPEPEGVLLQAYGRRSPYESSHDESAVHQTQVFGLFMAKIDEEARSARRYEDSRPSETFSDVPTRLDVSRDKKEGSRQEKGRQNQTVGTSRHLQRTQLSTGKEREELDQFFKTMYDITKRMPLEKQIEVRKEVWDLIMNAATQEDDQSGRI